MRPITPLFVSLSTILFGLLGLFAETLSFLVPGTSPESFQFIRTVRAFFMIDNPWLPAFRNLVIENEVSGLDFSFPRALVFLLFILAGSLYYFSKQKEIRLVKFLIGIFFFYSLLSILFTCINRIAFLFIENAPQSPIYFLLLWLGLQSGKAYLFYRIYTYLHAPEDLESEAGLKRVEGIVGLERKLVWVDTSKVQRVVHQLLDSILIALLCIPFFRLFPAFLNKSLIIPNWGRDTYDLLWATVFMFLGRLLYYGFFEGMWHTSPAKMLTGSRLVREDRGKIGIGTALKRTLARHIPFDALSYLGSGNGWHDSLLQTRVVKEESSGIKAGYYFWLLPIAILLLAGMEQGQKQWKENQQLALAEQIHDIRYKRNLQELNQLDENSLIHIRARNYPFASDYVYLKVENSTEEQVQFTVIPIKSNSWVQALETYREASEGQLTTLNIKKSQLLAALTEDYRQYSEKPNLVPLLYHKGMYEIKEVGKITDSDLHYRSSSFYPDYLTLQIQNKGFEANMVAIQNIKGDLSWSDPLPMYIQGVGNGKYASSFSLKAQNYQASRSYEAILTTEAGNGSQVKYYLSIRKNRQIILLPM